MFSIKTINWVGSWTLYEKEVMRFFRVYNQTIIAPIVNAVLFFFIFSLAFNHATPENKSSYDLFLIAGLVIMSAMNNSYNNGMIIVINKITGNIIDLVTIPLRRSEIIMALCLGSLTRAIITAITIYLTLCLLQQQFPMHNIFIACFFLLISSLICALIGLVSGLLFDNFEEASLVTNYFITPLLFLSGTFYSVKQLPMIVQKIIIFNPFLYMIDGTRFGIIGKSESNLVLGSIFLIAISIVLVFCANWILKTGYKIRK
jgi:ABC-2 type transport system permease protein